MKAEQRIYRTADGQFVPQGDPAAAFLAYPVGADVPESVVAQLKRASKPQDKARRGAEDKAEDASEVESEKPRRSRKSRE